MTHLLHLVRMVAVVSAGIADIAVITAIALHSDNHILMWMFLGGACIFGFSVISLGLISLFSWAHEDPTR